MLQKLYSKLKRVLLTFIEEIMIIITNYQNFKYIEIFPCTVVNLNWILHSLVIFLISMSHNDKYYPSIGYYCQPTNIDRTQREVLNTVYLIFWFHVRSWSINQLSMSSRPTLSKLEYWPIVKLAGKQSIFHLYYLTVTVSLFIIYPDVYHVKMICGSQSFLCN